MIEIAAFIAFAAIKLALVCYFERKATAAPRLVTQSECDAACAAYIMAPTAANAKAIAAINARIRANR